MIDQSPTQFDIESVFDPDDYFYFYENSLTSRRTELEIRFLKRELELENHHKILDLACGHGRHTNILAEKGYQMTGVDITPGFLKIARETAQEKGLSITYIQEDMRNITFENEFDRVLLLYTAFGYFDDTQNLKVLQNVSRALTPGGLFCFDSHNRDTLLTYMIPHGVTQHGEDLMIDNHHFDTLTGRLYNQRIIIRDGVRKEKPFFVRFYNPTEIYYLFEQVGLRLIKVYGSWLGESVTSKSHRMIVIGQKKE